MRKVLFGGVAALLALAVGSYVVVVRPALQPSSDVPRAERALATPDLAVLGSVNVKEAVFLEKWFLGTPIVDPAEPPRVPAVADRTLVEHLRAAGVALRGDLDQMLFALYRADGAIDRRAVVLLGRFDPVAIGGYLERELKGTVRGEAGRTVYDVTRPDPTTCEPAAPWTIAVDPAWILAADAATLASLLPRIAGTPQDGDATLAWWQPLAHADVLALGVVDPGTLGSAVTQPFLKSASQSLATETEGIDHAYLGLGVRPVPPQGQVRVVVDAADETRVAQRLQRFRAAVDDSRARWQDTMPNVAKLYRSLVTRADGTRTTIAFTVDRELRRNLQELVQEAVSALLSGLMGGLGAPAATPTAAPAERLDPSPAVFRPSVTAAELPPYDPHATFAEEVEAQQGPFGVRVDAIRLSADPSAGLEVTVAAYSGAIPNVVEGDEVLLYVDGVRSNAGQELLRVETCGKERNALPAKFRSGGAGLRAEKTVRLVPGVDPHTIQRVSGHVELRLPTRTETVSLPTSGPDATVERDGATFAVSGVQAGNVSYRIGGATDRVLHFRALNAGGKPLSSSGGSWSDFLFGEGRSGEKDYAGAVDRLEVVFADDVQSLQFPFALGDLSMTGGAGHAFPDSTPAFQPYGYAAMRADRFVANAWKPLPPPAKPEPHLATTSLGPFELSLDRAQAFYAMKLDFTVRSPALPNLQGGFSMGRLRMTRIDLKDGTSIEPPTSASAPPSLLQTTWERSLQFRAPRDGVLVTPLSLFVDTKAKPEDLKSVTGVLGVRFPTALDTVRLDDLTVGRTTEVPGATITVAARGRRSLTLDVSHAGDSVVYVRLLDADGQAIAFSGPQTTALGDDGKRLELMPMSPYARAEVVLATAQDTTSYPFVLTPAP